ncbi:MAG: hypothetical protein U0797_18010 [Gemmataceae bacterium]
MRRTLLCCAALTAFAVPARAEPTITSTEMFIRLTVRPMAAPKPALRYRLLPELREMSPGNPIPNYLKCMLDQDFSSDREALGRAALLQADRAARLDRPDWQILLKAKTDGISLLLPDVQKVRGLAAALQERFREENASGRLDDSARTAKTMFAMSRHMGEHPTLIGGLVGLAIANVALAPLEEMLEQPGCPNLYWALTDLPNPLVSLDRGMDGERLLIGAELRDLDDHAPMSTERINKLVAHINKLRELDQKDKGTRAWLDARNKDEKVLRAARQRLVEAGYPEERLTRFPADQVLLLDEKLAYEAARDEAMKLMKLPPWQIEPLAAKVPPMGKDRLFEFLVPALNKVRRAQGRLEQRVGLLRCVEALRLYAAAHDGKLPARLSDCGVPLPADPFTNKPFRYETDGDSAHLRGTPPPGEAKNPAYNVHYHITVRK